MILAVKSDDLMLKYKMECSKSSTSIFEIVYIHFGLFASPAPHISGKWLNDLTTRDFIYKLVTYSWKWTIPNKKINIVFCK